MLTKEQILQANDLPLQEVDVPEWGGSVFVKTMSGYARDRLETEFRKPQPENLRAMVAAYTICDEKGNLLFSAQDMKALGNKSSAALDRVFSVALQVNKISQEDVEQLQKN